MNAKELLIEFGKEWERKYGEQYCYAFAKEGAIFKRLLKTYSAERLRELLHYFFSHYRSDFVDRTGRTVGVFVSQIPNLIAAMKEQKSKEAVTNDDYERLEEARRRLSE
jgi:hypothetical protein